MKTLDKYVLREFSVTLIYCVVAFGFLEVLIDLFDKFARIVEAQAPLGKMLLYYGAILTQHMEFLMPAALLLTTLYTLWNFTRHGELTAMRASGVSIYRIMYPLLTVSLVIAVLTLTIKEFVSPNALYWADNYRDTAFLEEEGKTAENVAFLNTTANRQWLVGSFDLSDPHLLHDVEITEEDAAHNIPILKMEIGRAEWLDGEWWFFNVQSQKYTPAGNPIGIMKAVPSSELGLLMTDFTEKPADFVNEVKEWEYLSAWDMRRYLAAHPDLPAAAKAQRSVDVHLRLAFPWACFIVTLFGIPSGARHGRQSMLAGVLLTITCFFAFYFLTQFGVFLGKRGVLSPWLGAWMSNIVFFAMGIRMIVKIR